MNISEISKPVTSKALNESLAKKFGTRINIDKFTTEQLQDARNKIRTQLSQVEAKESFDKVQSESYQKSKLFLDVLNAAISEREDVVEAKPDFLDLDKDGNKKEPMKKAAKDAKKKVKEGKGTDFEDKFRKLQSRGGSIAYGVYDLIQSYGLDADRIMGFNPQVDQRKVRQFQIDRQERVLQMVKQQLGESTTEDRAEKAKQSRADKRIGDKIRKDAEITSPAMKKKKAGRDALMKMAGIKEGKEDEAELVMAAKDMVDRLTNWMEDTAQMQSESMLELADAIRDEQGQANADSFTNTVKPALEALYAAMESTRETLTGGVAMLTGEQAPEMGGELDVAPEAGDEMEPTVDMEADDDFAAAEPAAGGEEEAGRAKRESKSYSKKKLAERSRRLGSILSKKKS